MKRILLPMIVLVVGIALSAFTGSHPGSRKATSGAYFFDFTGTDQMDQGSYTKRSTQPSPGDVCPGSSVLCGIWADADPNNLTEPLQSDIDALEASYDSNHDGVFDSQHVNEVDFKAP